MRQRKVKNLELKYEDYNDILAGEPGAMRGKWAERAGGRPVYLEIGCGKGKFISEMAEREAGRFFVAVEGNKSVMLRAMEKVRAKALDNVVFIPEFAEDLSDWFGDGEVTGIYLNFSDPLPKNYWYRRRLTYRERLKSYFRVLGEDGTVTFKTDNTDFFEWSILEIMAADLRILDITRDLHASAAAIEDPEEKAAFNIETEYEAKFSGIGEKIKRVVIGRRVPKSVTAGQEDPESMATGRKILQSMTTDEDSCNCKFGETAAEGVNETTSGTIKEIANDSINDTTQEITNDTVNDTIDDAKEESEMITSMAAYNGRVIPEGDRNFGAVARAKAAIAEKGNDAVINATVGALYDDEGNLVVLDAVAEAMKELSGTDFADYAPIAGTPGFKEAIIKAAFGPYEPRSFVRAVATPGGTPAVRNAVANYSCPGDRILTHDLYWSPYKTIAIEQGKSLETFETFDEAGMFNIGDFGYKVSKLLRNQEYLVIILNTPAGNPTGYSMSMDDWYGVKSVLDGVPLDKKVALVVDAAYMDFAGEDAETREFLKVIDNLRANILPIIAYSASKTFTMYGMRCAAMICLAHSPEVADEFERVCAFSSRNTWSNSPRAPQTVIEKIYSDPELLAEVNAQRKSWRDILAARGKAFESEAARVGLSTYPFRMGFFVTIPYKDQDALIDALAKKDAFLMPVDGGVRVSIAATSEEKCRRLPALIKEAIEELG